MPRKHGLMLLLLAAPSIGCGRSTYPTTDVTGTVTIDGTPVAQGGITFTPLATRRGAGVFTVIQDGNYVAQRVPQGDLRVTVIAARETGRTVEIMTKRVPETIDIVPVKYRMGIDIELHGEKARRDFALDSQ